MFAQEFVNAPFHRKLFELCEFGQPCTIFVMGDDMVEKEVLCVVKFIDLKNGCYLVEKISDGRDKKFNFKHTYRVIDGNQSVISNECAYAYRNEVLKRRADRCAEIELSHLDKLAVLQRSEKRFQIAGCVDGEMNGEAKKFFLVYNSGSPNQGRALIHASSERELQRTLSLIQSDHGFWEIFPHLLQAKFLWVAWEKFKNHAIEAALEVRGTSPPCRSTTEHGERNARLEKYASIGLNWESLGQLSELGWLEGEPYDHLTVFKWAENMPSKALRSFLINAWDDQQYFYSSSRDSGELFQEEACGLVRRRSFIDLRERLEFTKIVDMREYIKCKNMKFKSRSKSELVSFLIGVNSMDVADFAEKKSLPPDYEAILPEGLSWRELQFMRSDYKHMYHSLLEWLRGKVSPPYQRPFFEALY